MKIQSQTIAVILLVLVMVAATFAVVLFWPDVSPGGDAGGKTGSAPSTTSSTSPIASFSPTLTVAVIGLFVAVFGVLALLYKQANLDHHTFAFGLPPGTIRATMAIGILIIFLTVPTYLFMQLGSLGPSNITPTGTTISSLPDNLPEGVFALEVKNGEATEWLLFSNASSTARERLAFQIFTAISTTLAAISAFYFGARTAQHSTRGELGASFIGPDGAQKEAHIRLAEMRAVSAKSDADLETMKATLAAINDIAENKTKTEEVLALRDLAAPVVSYKAPNLIKKMKDLIAQSDTLLSASPRNTALQSVATAKDLESYYDRFQESAGAFQLLRATLDLYLEDAHLAGA